MRILLPKPNITKRLPEYMLYLFVVYTLYLQYKWVAISNAVTILGAATLALVLLYMIVTRFPVADVLTGEVKILFVFYFISFVAGLFVSPDSSIHVNRCIESFLYFLLSICVIYVAKRCTNLEGVVIFFCLFAALCAAALLINPVLYRDTAIETNIRYSLASTLNVNTLGTYFTLGCWCMLFLITFHEKWSLAGIAYLVVMLLAVNLTGSRKNLLSIIIMVVFWLFFVKFRNNKANLAGNIIYIAVVCLAAYIIFTKVFVGSTMALRMQQLLQKLTTDSDNYSRITMYKQGWELFKEHTFLGIGFYGYAHYYEVYSHTTYIEVLCCTGLIGSVLYFGMYIYSIRKLRKLIRRTNNNQKLYQANMMLRMAMIMWAELIFMAVGVIHIYLVISFLSFGILFATISKAERMIRECNYGE